MREVHVGQLQTAIYEMVQTMNYDYPKDVALCLQTAKETESSVRGREILEQMTENRRIAQENQIPLCQDTGMVIVFLTVGQEVHFVGGDVKEAIYAGVAKGYRDGCLRMSVVSDPLFDRVNTGNNTPCVIYTDLVAGDEVTLEVCAKGFGSENMSKLVMLKPAQGVQGVKDAVLQAVKEAGPNACPPMVIGIGIGGTFDYAAVLAKKALTCEAHTKDERYVELEQQLLNEINQLNIGPLGLKGDTTAWKVSIESFATHIAGLPCAINISCHVSRHAKRVIE